MPAPDEPARRPEPGLRARKRVALRRRMQEEALRLFASQGYERTTVEQIAAAADTSTTTFYRYFPAKEDVVLQGDVNDVIETELLARPPEEPLAEVFRAVAGAVLGFVEEDEAFHLERLRLAVTVPALRAHYARDEAAMVGLMSRVAEARTGLPADDDRIELVAAIVTAAVFTAGRRWAFGGGTRPLDALLDRAIGAVTPSVEALLPAR